VKRCSREATGPPGEPYGPLRVTDLWCSSECTPPCQGGGRGFKSRQVRSQRPTAPAGGRTWLPGRVAQLVERAPEKREVRGSMPRPTTARWHGRSDHLTCGAFVPLAASGWVRPSIQPSHSDVEPSRPSCERPPTLDW
jgi:hypothetical protein